MSQTLMQQLVKYEEACCIYGYFEAHKDKTNSAIAARLGVSSNAVRAWRKKIEAGEVTCGYGASGFPGCLFRDHIPDQNGPV